MVTNACIMTHVGKKQKKVHTRIENEWLTIASIPHPVVNRENKNSICLVYDS